MGNRVLVFALFAAVAAGPLPAAAAPPPAAGAAEPARPLRTVSFDFDLHVARLTETPGGNVLVGQPAVATTKSGAPIRPRLATRGSGEATVKHIFSTKGTIVVDVLQATEDSGLVVDVEENAIERSRPKVRMAIGPDGSLFYEPRNAADVTEEELAVARWMSRGFYGDHPTVPGTSWTVDQSWSGRTDLEHYRVVERDAQRVTLDYSLDEKVAGVSGYLATRAGSLVYDRTLSVPVKATFQTDSRRAAQGSYETTRTTVALTLAADSFASARKP